MLRRVGVTVRLTVLAVVVTVAVVTLVAVGFTELRSQVTVQKEVNALGAARAAAQTVQFDFADFNGWQTAYAFDVTRLGPSAAADSADSRKAFLASVARTRTDIAALQALTANSAASVRTDLSAVAGGLTTFMQVDDQVVALYRRGDRAARLTADKLVLGQEISVFGTATQHLSSAADALAAQQRSATDSASSQGDTAIKLMLGAGALILLFVIGASTLISRSIRGPLQGLRSRLDAISHGRGDLTARLDVEGKDELSDVATLFNSFVASIAAIVREVSGVTTAMASSAEELSSVSAQLDSGAAQTTLQVGEMSAAARNVADSTASMSAATEEMTASISEIATQASSASQVATEAVATVADTSSAVSELDTASAEIGEIVKVITSIAEQTNLLALNATIEAARAGDAGKGFAVVAAEVKDLAQETARATDDITAKIGAIQSTTQRATDAIGRISSIMDQIHEKQTTIAAAVEEQTATTMEISRNVSGVAGGADQMAVNLEPISANAAQTSAGANATQQSASELASLAAKVQSLLGSFTY